MTCRGCMNHLMFFHISDWKCMALNVIYVFSDPFSLRINLNMRVLSEACKEIGLIDKKTGKSQSIY